MECLQNSKEWKKQGEHFKEYKEYLEEHFQDLVHHATTCEIQTMSKNIVNERFAELIYLPILIAYLNKAPAVKEALTMQAKVRGI